MCNIYAGFSVYAINSCGGNRGQPEELYEQMTKYFKERKNLNQNSEIQ